MEIQYFIKKRNENNKNKDFDEKQEKCQESKWKYKVAFFFVKCLMGHYAFLHRINTFGARN